MADIIQMRRDVAAQWTAVNPILAEGEFGVEIDTNNYKFGNGVNAWNDLPYVVQNVSSLGYPLIGLWSTPAIGLQQPYQAVFSKDRLWIITSTPSNYFVLFGLNGQFLQALSYNPVTTAIGEVTGPIFDAGILEPGLGVGSLFDAEDIDPGIDNGIVTVGVWASVAFAHQWAIAVDGTITSNARTDLAGDQTGADAWSNTMSKITGTDKYFSVLALDTITSNTSAIAAATISGAYPNISFVLQGAGNLTGGEPWREVNHNINEFNDNGFLAARRQTTTIAQAQYIQHTPFVIGDVLSVDRPDGNTIQPGPYPAVGLRDNPYGLFSDIYSNREGSVVVELVGTSLVEIEWFSGSGQDQDAADTRFYALDDVDPTNPNLNPFAVRRYRQRTVSPSIAVIDGVQIDANGFLVLDINQLDPNSTSFNVVESVPPTLPVVIRMGIDQQHRLFFRFTITVVSLLELADEYAN